MTRTRRRLSLSLAVLGLAGCRTAAPPVSAPPPPPPVATGPTAPLPQTFDDPTVGIRFSYPAGWTAQPTTGTTVLRAVAPPGAGGSAVLTVDVPELPPHIPGLIPVGLVASGYVDDVRKRMPDAAGPPPAAVAVPDAAARRVALAGHAGSDDAVLIVHGDRVYVLAVDADPAARPAATAALGGAVASIRWTR